MKRGIRILGMTAVAMLILSWAFAQAQTVRVDVSARAWASNVVVPQSRSMSLDARNRIEVTGITLDVSILDQAATTTLDIELRNPTNSRLEAEMLVPVPEGAAIKAFTFQGAAKEPTAELLPKDKALATYKSIVSHMRDPALLEFAGCNLIRSSVFPVDAHGTQKVRLTYEHLLEADGNRVDYILPRTEALDYKVPWQATVKIQSKGPISTVYSSSHKYEVTKPHDNVALLKIDKQAMHDPGSLQISYLKEGSQGLTSTLFTYPDPKIDGGYFLLLAGVPAKAKDADGNGAKRELTIVIDRSGSMAGAKIAQVKAAALQILDGMDDGETFNIIDYSDSISSFATAPVVKGKTTALEARKYIEKISAANGTNLHDAILEALRPRPADGMLPLVLFLTDGLPTVGVRDEATIRQAVIKGNTYNRRIFTFGVGYDVNAPLLTNLAQNSRAISTFVQPTEEIEAKVSQVFRRLVGPVLSAPKLALIDDKGRVLERTRMNDLIPGKLPDLFEGDQLVVLGKYTGTDPIRFALTGDFMGKTRKYTYDFKLDKATTRNSFVPRLWASRKIALMIEEIRQAGAELAANPALAHGKAPTDPKMKELTDEIVRLSMEFGILTEYTSFLAKEGTDLTRTVDNGKTAQYNLYQRAQMTRTGIGGFNQGVNNESQIVQSRQNMRNGFYDENMKRVEIVSVQQVNDRALFRQGGRWVDSQAIGNNSARVDSVVRIGTPEYDAMVDKLVSQHRNGAMAVNGEVLLNVDGKNVLVKNN